MLSRNEARRLALAAQGFYDPLPAKPSRASLRRTLERTGLFQIDSVNVLVRAHYLPLFSRLGPYPRALLNDAAWGATSKRTLFEYWGHEASLIPLELRPLFEWRMERARSGRGTWSHVSAIRTKKKFVESVRRAIETGGPATASSFKDARGEGGWWGWSEVKVALEYLFWAGELTAKTRTSAFERVYDVPERVLEPAVLRAPVPPRPEQYRDLAAIALRSMGVATEPDVRDYFRLPPAEARSALLQLVDEGVAERVEIEGWGKPAYLATDANVPRKEPPRTALLSPFDSLVWNRQRVHRLFDFHYRIEIYTPAHKRIHGYYVLPLLHDGRLVGRVDLKADRDARALLVKGEHYESGVVRDAVRAALDAQLQALAEWLELSAVERPKRR